MSYDQGYWHTDSCTKKGVDEQYAGTHIAVYLKWCIDRAFLAASLEASDAEILKAVRAGEMPASTYFEQYLDWKFGEWCLNDQGNAFTASYYNQYLQEVSVQFPNAIFGPEADIDFTRLYSLLDERLAQFLNLGPEGVPWRRKKTPW